MEAPLVPLCRCLWCVWEGLYRYFPECGACFCTAWCQVEQVSCHNPCRLANASVSMSRCQEVLFYPIKRRMIECVRFQAIEVTFFDFWAVICEAVLISIISLWWFALFCLTSFWSLGLFLTRFKEFFRVFCVSHCGGGYFQVQVRHIVVIVWINKCYGRHWGFNYFQFSLFCCVTCSLHLVVLRCHGGLCMVKNILIVFPSGNFVSFHIFI